MRPKVRVTQGFTGRNTTSGTTVYVDLMVDTSGNVIIHNFTSPNAITINQGYCTIAYIVD